MERRVIDLLKPAAPNHEATDIVAAGSPFGRDGAWRNRSGRIPRGGGRRHQPILSFRQNSGIFFRPVRLLGWPLVANTGGRDLAVPRCAIGSSRPQILSVGLKILTRR